MSKASSKLRRGAGCFFHWCPACEEMHALPDSWSFDGNFESPTFTPSFKHTGAQKIIVDGKWTGEWAIDAEGKPERYVCHYVLTDGVLNFCADCTHALAGKSVLLPELPTGLTDGD